jgi:hypothetical protein
MKQNFWAILATASIAIFSSINASAQTPVNTEIAKLDNSFAATESASANTNAAASKINSNALKNFSKQFKSIANANWFVTNDNGFAAVFSDKSCRTTAVYNSKGRFVYSISRYGANEMPAQLRSDIQAAYEAYNIICAEKITVDGDAVYLVHIQTDRLSKTVRVANGDMDVIETLSKY